MKNILITGSSGQLGSEFRQIADSHSDYNFFFTDVSDFDITNYTVCKNFIEKNKINTIINCAAYTYVDKAEDEPILADKINHLGVKNLALISKQTLTNIIHISTDYVFDGCNSKPYDENDIPNPKSVYGQTKLDGELAIKAINPPNSIIIRVSWLYSEFGNNFVKKMVRFSKIKDKINVISDQLGSPTYALDLAKAIMKIIPKIKNQSVEIYHYSNEGICSWYELAVEIFNLKATNISVNPIKSSEFNFIVERPSYSVLDKRKIKTSFEINIPFWKDSLNLALKKIKDEN